MNFSTWRNALRGARGSHGAGCLATPYASMWRAARPTRSPRPWMRLWLKSLRMGVKRVTIPSWRRLPAGGWSRASGNLAGRDLVGRFARPDRLGPRLPEARSSCSKRRTQPEPNLYGGLRPADQQSEMGSCSGQRQLIGAGYRTAKRFGRQCLASYFSRPITAGGTRRQTPAAQVGVTFFGD